MAGLSNDMWENWDKTGKSDFLKTCGQLIKETKTADVSDKHGKPSLLLQYIAELVDRGIKGSIRKDSVVNTLQDLVRLNSDLIGVILDVLSITDVVSIQDGPGENSKERANFCEVVKECEKFFSDKLLKERLEIDTLQEVGILKNKTFYSKFIKVKTKLYYKQRKFNLFREESEGYAKLQTELNQKFGSGVTHAHLLDIVQSLIGCFNLDPNRVLDVILESFENNPQNAQLFIPLIRSYMDDPKIISEVLAFKYNFLSDRIIPRSLHMLTALLLQGQLIALDDIYFWLSPDDKTMERENDKALTDAKEYARKMQIISLSKEKEDVVDEPENLLEKYHLNHKLCLCNALLSIGDWHNAKILIDRMPEHYAMSFDTVAVELCNLLHYVIDPVYKEHCKLGPKIKGRVIPPHPYPLDVKCAYTFEDLHANAVPMIITLGPSLRFDPVLMYKMIRLARAALYSSGVEVCSSKTTRKEPSLPIGNENADLNNMDRQTNNFEENQCKLIRKSPGEIILFYDILTLFDCAILPALSYMDCNCCIAEEIWTVLRLYPYENRYCLYSRWKNETYANYPDLIRKRADSEKHIKNLMKRVSKENIKPVGRLIGKLTHCSPGYLFDYILLQIQVYSNLIMPVVDSLKYLTNLSYDVLGFCLVECLANADKNRVKHDSTSISGWLQSLSAFCGAVYKKYVIELTGMLQYVANQLKCQKSLDLLILKEVVQKMAGVEVAEDLTMEQINAMSGGELLKAEAGYFSQVRNTKKSSLRLREAMVEHNLAVTLCLLMAQQNYCVVYRETQKNHLKLVGKLADQCQDTLVQFGTFLGSSLSVDEYVNKLPSMQSMLIDYHIPTEVAFFLARPMFNHAINLKYDQLRKADTNYKKMATAVKNQKYYEAVCEVMEPVHLSIVPLYPQKIWEEITPQFLSTFWSLTMYDLYVPEEMYQSVITKIKHQSLAAMDLNTTAGTVANPSLSSSTIAKGKKEQERYITLMEKLQDEKKKQHEHVDKVMFRLKQEKDHWFISRSVRMARNEAITRFLQLCLFPRSIFTSIDAVYCAKFVHTIHLLRTPNFSTLLCYDRLFCDVTYSITSCTENEATRYGRFLFAMLETVMRWHKSKEQFEKECTNYPGFVTKYRVNNQYADNLDNVGYENFRHVCHKWHYKLAKAMVTCLESKDYVQIRNSLIVLIKIIAYFPVLQKLAQFIEKRIEKVRDDEKNNRQDLFTLSSSYLGLLKQRIRTGVMVKESDFHILVDKEKLASKHQTDSNAPKVDTAAKPSNGEIKATEQNPTIKERSTPDTKKVKLSDTQEPKAPSKQISSSNIPSISTPAEQNVVRDKSDRVTHREESREKHSVPSSSRGSSRAKEEKREEADKDGERDKRRELRKDKKMAKEDRQSREERYLEMVSPKDDSSRYGSNERFYDREGSASAHYYRDVIRDERELLQSMSGSNSSGSNNLPGGRHSVQDEQEIERDSKRQKVDSGSAKSSKHEDRKLQQQLLQQQQINQHLEDLRTEHQLLQQQQQLQDYHHHHHQAFSVSSMKSEKKERQTKSKDKREKLSEEEKELRKERKLGRKRDREDALQQPELKRRRDEEKVAKLMSHNQNGDVLEAISHQRGDIKHHRSRDPSHDDRIETREKHRRNAENKRR